jgi:hypothetical protein
MILRLLFIACAAIAAPKIPVTCAPDLASEDSVQKGILSHGEHWVDLILAQSARETKEPLEAFETFARQLLQAAAEGRMKIVNEKIDGSPSVVFGWNADGKPFIAYKNHFSAVKQKLVTDRESALSVFPRSEALKHIFSTLFAAIEPAMRGQRGLKDFVFQGDLLFVKEEDRRTIQQDGVHIRANTVEYLVTPGDPLHGPLSRAAVGVAIHTVGRRTIAPDGRLGVEALTDENARALLEKFIARTSSEGVFLMHPLRDDVMTGTPLDPQDKARAAQLLKNIREKIEMLTPEFNALARTQWLPELRVYFNSQLRPPNDGGIFRLAKEGADIDYRALAFDFGNWLKARNKPGALAAFEQAPPAIHKQLAALIGAYVDAIRLQYHLLPHLAGAMVSKLGGGPVEGLILTQGPYIVKFVDRLDFTLQNNANRESAPLPAPFDVWRPGAAFMLMKGQPVHEGHIMTIRLANALHPVFTVLASQKEPHLEATKLSELGAAANQSEYRARNYKHVFSRELRDRIFRAGLDESVQVHQVNTVNLWRYLDKAMRDGAEGKITLVVGQKEIDEGRYNEQLARYGSHLELAPFEMQAGGLSATQIRQWIKDEDVVKLREAYSFIPNEIDREGIIQHMIREWKAVDEKAQSLLPKKKAG